jgi:hypothetical protein
MNRKLLLFGVILCSALTASAVEPPRQTLSLLKGATGRVVVGRGDDGDVVGTAFLYSTNRLAVTCLHVVAGAEDITVTFSSGERRGTLIKSLRSHDLALIRLDEEVEGQPLDTRRLDGDERPDLIAYGAFYGNSRLSSSRVNVRDVGGRRLRDIISNQAQRTQISNAGCPSLDAEILDVEGSLVPGISGGPLCDFDGQVVGVCNGGLESGATERVWAIPGSKLAALLDSDEDAAQSSRRIARSNLAFSEISEEDADEGATRVGRRSLVKLRTRRLREIVNTSDDTVGLTQIMNAFAGFQPHLWEFDIYRDTESGASLVVPAGEALDGNGPDINVRLNRAINLLFNISSDLDDDEVQEESSGFEARLKVFVPHTFWARDNQWSYWGPRMAAHGMIFNRSSWSMMAQGFDYYGNPVPVVQRALMLTFAAYEGNLISVAARRDVAFGVGPEIDQAWGQAAISVHMATFPAPSTE